MERNYSIDFIKFFATFFVITIHVNPSHDDFFSGNPESALDIIVDTFARFSVPFFFMVSGYLFSQKLKSTSNSFSYLKKYIWNITKLYICWFIFYLIFGVIISFFQNYGTWAERKNETIQYLTSALTFQDIFYYGSDTGGFQLWYLIALVWCIFILYIFYKLKQINWLLTISLLLYTVGLFGQSYSKFFNFSFQTRDALFFGLFYTTLGCFLSLKGEVIRNRLRIKPTFYLYLFFSFSFLEILERISLVNILHSSRGDYFISTIFLSLSLFLFVISSPELGKGSILAKIGKNSVGIYVVHIFILNEVYKFLISLDKKIFTESIISYLVITPFVFLVSHIVYQFLQRIKGKFRDAKSISITTNQ